MGEETSYLTAKHATPSQREGNCKITCLVHEHIMTASATARYRMMPPWTWGGTDLTNQTFGYSAVQALFSFTELGAMPGWTTQWTELCVWEKRFLLQSFLSQWKTTVNNINRFLGNIDWWLIAIYACRLGKTIQVVCYLAGMFDAGLIKSALIVLPVSLLQNWETEFSKW